MMINRDFRGETGAVYRYQHVAKEPPPGAGNFLYVRAHPDQPATILYSGEAERLTTGIGARWREAVEQHGATHIYARRNVTARVRSEEMADLVSAHEPVMNAESGR